MRSARVRIENFLVSRVAALLRLTGLVSIASGVVGGYVWVAAWLDRGDGDALRYGFFHNPFMQFPPFNEPFLDASIYVLLACSAAAGVGGLMLLVPLKWGVPLVTWQARVSIVTNGVVAFFIFVMLFVFAKNQVKEWHLGGTRVALALRLGSVAVDLLLWVFLSGDAVRGFWDRHSHPPERAFDVIMKDPVGRAGGERFVPAEPVQRRG